MTAPNTDPTTEQVITNLRENILIPSLPVGPETMLTAVAESQRELFQFIKMRLEKDGDTARKVIGCRKWTDALDAQTRWAQEVVQDYSAEVTKMMSIYTGNLTESAHGKGRHP